MRLKLPLVIVGLGFALFLTSCEQQPQGEKVAPTFDRTNKEMTIMVRTYPTHVEVTRKLHEFNREKGITNSKPPHSLGWAAWNTEAPYACVINVKTPARVDDDDITTLGHELAHCIYGSYHK